MSNSSLEAPVSKRLEGKVALITGGANGIGASTARLFVKHGAKVVIADIQDELGASLAEEIGYDDAIFIHCDVTIEPDVENAVDTAIAKYGKLDIMFSNAGTLGKPISSIMEANEDIIKRVFEVNVYGSFFCGKHAARVMIPGKKKGNIIFTASIAGTMSFRDIPHTYASSKSATLGLAKSLAVELGQYGIRVNCISPYAVATPLILNVLGLNTEQGNELFREAANMKGTTLVELDCAEAALYLASDESKYVSGLNLVIDGGFTATNTAFAEAINKISL